MALTPLDSASLDLPFHDTPRYQTVLRGPVQIAGRLLSVTPVFYAYWRFAAERQLIFHRRLDNAISGRLTDDPVLLRYKFTNAYRASDRVSQFLIREVIYRDDLPTDKENLFYRILLFKLFNKIETWRYLEECMGPLVWEDFDYSQMESVLGSRMEAGERIYSAAYIIPPATGAFGQPLKHQNHLRLIEYLMERNFATQLANCTSMRSAFQLLITIPSFGPFLAYQFATDFNYSPLTAFSEAEFVVAGPGALDGIHKCFANAADLAPADIINYMYQHQQMHFVEQQIDFIDLWGRPLQLIDCQNLFCEISKYARVAFPEHEGVAGRTRIKQKFVAGAPLPRPWYPPDWGLNERIANSAN